MTGIIPRAALPAAAVRPHLDPPAADRTLPPVPTQPRRKNNCLRVIRPAAALGRLQFFLPRNAGAQASSPASGWRLPRGLPQNGEKFSHEKCSTVVRDRIPLFAPVFIVGGGLSIGPAPGSIHLWWGEAPTSRRRLCALRLARTLAPPACSWWPCVLERSWRFSMT